MFQISTINSIQKEEKEEEENETDDVINKTVSYASFKSTITSTTTSTKTSSSSLFTITTANSDLISTNFTKNHSEFILNGLKLLKSNKILCDITLIAENKRFDVHKVLMASCSDYFRSMFTNGMKECQQTEIELKGVSAIGLEKVIEIIYTSNTQFDSNEELFDCIAAANLMQCLLAIDVCEKDFINRITCHNFNYLIQMAKFYRLKNALKQIDLFILNNLTKIILSMTNTTTTTYNKSNNKSENLTFEQLLKCLTANDLKIKEIDLFYLTWRWFLANINIKSKSSIKIIRSLLKQIRFALISPNDLVTKVQCINKLMLNDKCLRGLVMNALNYHLMPHNNNNHSLKHRKLLKYNYSTSGSSNININNNNNNEEDEYNSNVDMRSTITSVLIIGGREISPVPNLHDKCFLLNNYFNIENNSQQKQSSDIILNNDDNDSQPLTVLTNLPNNLSHMQCVIVANNYLYVIGGCVSQCAHGESASSVVYKYDPRFSAWKMVKSMYEKRSYFYACALSEKSTNKRKINLTNNTNHDEYIYSIGGRNKEGSLNSVEKYDLKTDSWHKVCMLPSALYAHAGCESNSIIYVTGGYGGSTPHNQFTSDLYSYHSQTNEWFQLRPMNSARGWHCMCKIQDKLYVFGGCILLANNNNNMNNVANQQPQIAHPVLTTEYYSIETNQWTLVKPIVNLHKEANCIHLNNYVYVLGGYNIQAKTGQKLISRYDYTNDVWHTFAHSLPAGMTGMGCVLIDLPFYLLNNNNNTTNNENLLLTSLLNNPVDTDENSDEDDDEEDYYEGGDEQEKESDNLKL